MLLKDKKSKKNKPYKTHKTYIKLKKYKKTKLNNKNNQNKQNIHILSGGDELSVPKSLEPQAPKSKSFEPQASKGKGQGQGQSYDYKKYKQGGIEHINKLSSNERKKAYNSLVERKNYINSYINSKHQVQKYVHETTLPEHIEGLHSHIESIRQKKAEANAAYEAKYAPQQYTNSSGATHTKRPSESFFDILKRFVPTRDTNMRTNKLEAELEKLSGSNSKYRSEYVNKMVNSEYGKYNKYRTESEKLEGILEKLRQQQTNNRTE